ncbi:fasciclin domain-containing protein [Parapedobacter deserti]|uniref:Fasciclin domain-containing protein n=1 Tax=Parapedobacter deserti TaxID=1912957 RepID=A0ABV7JIL3_9SPHI
MLQRKTLWILCPLACVAIGFLACDKQEVYREVDYNRITAIVNDNFNLSSFAVALDRTGMDEVLQEEEGPFTVLIPSDEAFRHSGLSNVRTMSAARLGPLVNYHILNGRYELEKFPYLLNQEIQSKGGKLYVSRWIKGADTVLSINGARVVLKDLPASNGRIQIINRVLEPYAHETLAEAAMADTTTLFVEALRRCGLMDTLRGPGPYTVFAPSNHAMRRFGYASIQQVKEANPAVLRALCEFHIGPDRRFVNDYILSTGSSHIGSQRMINTFTVTVKLIPNSSEPSGFSGIRLAAPGNTTDVNISRQDILAGNGVLHIVDDVLRLTR